MSLAGFGKWEEATAHYSRAAALKPQNVNYRYHVALGLDNQGQTASAMEAYRQTLALDPRFALALDRLAWIFATHRDARFRNGPEAVKLATQACELTDWGNPLFLQTLSAACAEAGRFSEAINFANRAVNQAEATGDRELADNVRKLLELYRSNRAYHP
jgi:serine/threonine-protein kinase